jgi:hypothetical protein
MSAVWALLPDGQRVEAWTAAAVEERLREALRCLAYLPSKGCFPDRAQSGWPDTIQRPGDWLPVLGAESFKQDYEHLKERIAEERHRVRAVPTAAAITRMEEALAWQHLVEPRRHFQALAAHCQGERPSITARRLNIGRETLRRWRHGALAQIATKLNRRGRVVL